MSRENAGLIWGFIGVMAFSLTLPMTRIAVDVLDPIQISVWRALVATCAASLIIVVSRTRRPRGKEYPYLLLAACGTVFGFPTFTTLAMQSGSAAHGAVVVGLLPLATAVVGSAVNGERPGLIFWLSCLFGTAVTLTYVLYQSSGSFSLPDLYLLAAVASAAVGYAFGGKAAKTLGGWQVACWALVLSIPVLVPLGFVVPPVPLSSPTNVLLAFSYVALVSQLSGFFAWYRGVALGGVARVSQVQLLQLFLTVLAAWLLLGETLEARTFGFGFLVVLSIWVGTRSKMGRPRTQPEATAASQ